MASEQPLPFFKFFPQDWLSCPDVICMTAEQRGAYIHLMALCWANNLELPAEDEKLSAMCGLAMAELSPVIAKLVESPNNPQKRAFKRLVEEWGNAKRYKTDRSSAGKKGAKSRWVNGRAMAKPKLSDGKAMAKDGYKEKEKEKEKDNNTPSPDGSGIKSPSKSEFIYLGENGNVPLTPQDLQELYDKHGKELIDRAIQKVDDWVAGDTAHASKWSRKKKVRGAYAILNSTTKWPQKESKNEMSQPATFTDKPINPDEFKL